MASFAFDARRHEYVDEDAGEVLPHITGMLERSGWVDDRWFTEESCERGSIVHRLSADYDLGAIENVESVTSQYKPWLLAHVKGIGLVRPEWTHVEIPLVSAVYRYGGRPDRCGLMYGAVAVAEIKSGPIGKAHAIQTALQAILLAPEVGLPAEAIHRYGWYVTGRGKFRLEQFVARADFDAAYTVIRQTCGVMV